MTQNQGILDDLITVTKPPKAIYSHGSVHKCHDYTIAASIHLLYCPPPPSPKNGAYFVVCGVDVSEFG